MASPSTRFVLEETVDDTIRWDKKAVLQRLIQRNIMKLLTRMEP
jgi:hypothetical protein